MDAGKHTIDRKSQLRQKRRLAWSTLMRNITLGWMIVAVPALTAAASANPVESTSPATTASAAPQPDGAAQFFTQKCSGCHTIGKGNLVGPDLSDVASWKTDELTASVKRMEKFAGPLADETVTELVKFLKDQAAKDRLKAEEERAAATIGMTAEPASALVGMKLFIGGDRFQNGGMSCIACHQVQGHGGTMGKDLTDSFEKLGQQALISTCEQPSYPVMKAIYKESPLTKQEALHITKYLETLKGSTERRPDPPFALVGTAGAFGFLVLLIYFYRGRNTGAHARLARRRNHVVD